MKYTIAGTTGDTTAGTLLEADNFTFNGLRLERAQWSNTGFSTNLLWSGNKNIPFLELTAGEDSVDFSRFGGIANDADDATGDVLFTTTGYTASGNASSFILEFKKKNAAAPQSSFNWEATPTLGSIAFTGGTAPTVVNA